MQNAKRSRVRQKTNWKSLQRDIKQVCVEAPPQRYNRLGFTTTWFLIQFCPLFPWKTRRCVSAQSAEVSTIRFFASSDSRFWIKPGYPSCLIDLNTTGVCLELTPVEAGQTSSIFTQTSLIGLYLPWGVVARIHCVRITANACPECQEGIKYEVDNVKKAMDMQNARRLLEEKG